MQIKRAPHQKTLFDRPIRLPNGFIYRPDFLTREEEAELVGYIEDLPLVNGKGSAGYYAKRRYLNFGWGYDFSKKKMIPDGDLPPFLKPLQRKVAKWLDIPASRVVEALISEYTKGSGIGWHRDNEPVEHIVGISLSGWCRLRLRPYERPRRASSVISLPLEPRSAYLMQKDARFNYQHSIPSVEALRYSITLRTLPAYF
jgi:alkylated DNA repair dioxygenase AlkB